jgi:CheY-like chemotaxis protein
LLAFFQPTEDPNHVSSLPNHPYTQITQPASEDSTVPDTSVGSIIISVTDSGPGLSVEQQQFMFQEGVQFNPGELQSGQANGLTLWISKEIISLHHGTIRVHSHGLGFGSTFEIILRVYLQPTPPPTPTAEILPNSIFIGDREVEMPPRLASSTLVVTSSEVLLGGTNDPPQQQPQPFQTPVIQSPPRVLVVDDTPSCRKIVSRLLKSKGFVCNEAENGEVCVKMVLSGEYEYDFILLDFEMPVMNGPTAARKLREAKSEVLIIGLTGNVLPEDKEYFLDHGANAVLFKPLVLQDLLDYFHRHRSNETKV